MMGVRPVRLGSVRREAGRARDARDGKEECGADGETVSLSSEEWGETSFPMGDDGAGAAPTGTPLAEGLLYRESTVVPGIAKKRYGVLFRCVICFVLEGGASSRPGRKDGGSACRVSVRGDAAPAPSR